MRGAYALVPLLLGGCASSSQGPAAAPTGAAASEPAPVATHETVEPNAGHSGHGHHMHHRFDDAEAWAKQFDDPSRDAWQKPDEVIAWIDPAEDAVVADIGAGTGYFAMRFAAKVPQGRVVANDVEADMVRYLTERAEREGRSNLVAVLGTAQDPALPDELDLVFLCDVYHHIGDRPAFFGKIASKLAPGGRVVIVDFKKDAPADIPGPPPKMRVAMETIVAELEPVGLSLSRAERQLLPHQYVVELVATP